MRISIITATFNSIKHLPDAINSIRCQYFENIEFITIDGGSIDGTTEFIKNCDLINKYISEPDNGIYDALNKGIKMASGDIIGFLHSDDMFASPQTLQNIANAFNTVSNQTGKLPDVIHGDLVFSDQQNTEKIVRYWKSQACKPHLLNRGWMPPHPTVFMRREVYEKHGFFNINLKCSADYDYILRVYQDKTLTLSYIPEVITKMRMGGISTGGVKNLINKKKEDYMVLRNNKMPFPLWIIILKNISKIPQILFRNRYRQI